MLHEPASCDSFTLDIFQPQFLHLGGRGQFLWGVTPYGPLEFVEDSRRARTADLRAMGPHTTGLIGDPIPGVREARFSRSANLRQFRKTYQ
jgi:hypothetical protein